MQATALCVARSGERAGVCCENISLSHVLGRQPSPLPSLPWSQVFLTQLKQQPVPRTEEGTWGTSHQEASQNPDPYLERCLETFPKRQSWV